ncbi:MAG: GNAT family N-acetyltransferase [Methanobacterium sp.]|nr:GNAT family N-acetyltransferase [Methanobacterium sp.]
MKLKELDLKKYDLNQISEMIYETDQNLFGTFLDKEPVKAVAKLKKLIEAGKNSYGHEHIYIAEDENGAIQGVLVAFRGDDIGFIQEAKIFKTTMNFKDFFKLTFIKPVYDSLTASSIRDDDFYIGNLVVSANLRGKGIGSKIIEQSFELARDKECKRVLLDVIFENQGAKKLYERIGFKKCCEKNLWWSSKSDGTYGMEYSLKNE